MHLYVKHATLINNCYPEKEGEKARSSELSYLTFYASSRPVKLTKVGIFLEKKVERDVLKNRNQSNKVSLEIVKALIQSCNRDLNLFSKYVLRILTLLIDCKDIELIDLTCDTFIMFSNYHDGSTLGVDAGFTSDFEALVKRFAEFCTSNDLEKRCIGHRAIQATISSAALHTSSFTAQLELVLPPLITTLARAGTPANELAKSAEAGDIQKPTVGNNDLNDETVCIIAARSIALLFNGLNGASVRTALSTLFTQIDNKKKWWPPSFAVSMVELVLESLQPQNRYLLISELLLQVENTKKDKDSYAPSEKLASLVSIIDAVLNANIPLVGISVLEILNSLFTILIKSLQGGTFRSDTDARDANGKLEAIIHQGLAHSIGGLALQIYYQHQLNDITSYIIAKMRPSTSLEHVDGLAIHEFRHVALICLDQIVATSKEVALENDTSSNFDDTNSGVNLALSTWTPAIALLTCDSPGTRVEFAASLTRFLEVTTAEVDPTLDLYPKHLLNQHGDVTFLNALQQAIVDWMQLPDCNVRDVEAMHVLLGALTRRFGADGTIRNLPLVFHLQTLSQANTITPVSRQRALAAVPVEWLDAVAVSHQISRLTEYVQQIRNDRIKNQEYSALFNPENRDMVVNSYDFAELEVENITPVRHFIDRNVVVEIMSKDGAFRDDDDTDGVDLESKLHVEWGSAAFVNQERSFRIRSSQDFDTFKPKLATPWVASDFNGSQQGQKNTICVENLKEALISQQQSTNGELELDALQIMTKKSLAKRSKETQADIDQVLSTINVGPVLQSTPSLVNPPYSG